LAITNRRQLIPSLDLTRQLSLDLAPSKKK
jgi:hypothetical protein